MRMYDKNKASDFAVAVSNAKYWIAMAISAGAAIVLVPLLGSYATGKTQFPQDTLGWILYFTCAIAVSICSVMIFLAFNGQGKSNIKGDPDFQKAREMYRARLKRENRKYIPKDPFKWEKNAKTKKVFFQSISVILGIIGLGAAVLTYNYTQLISSIFAMLMSAVFGLIHMGEVEHMFTDGWLEYEEYMLETAEEEDRKKKAEEAFMKEQTLEEQIKEVIDENQQ